jgi:hypothetical protein
VGKTQDPDKLDERLMTAWAELRTMSQLQKEGFAEIRKVEVTADLTIVDPKN